MARSVSPGWWWLAYFLSCHMFADAYIRFPVPQGRRLQPDLARRVVSTASAGAPTPVQSPSISRTERGQKLRALNWLKQVRQELTSAEFALKLDGAGIDYDTIIVRLERNLAQLQRARDSESGGGTGLVQASSENDLEELQSRLLEMVESVSAAHAAQSGSPDSSSETRADSARDRRRVSASASSALARSSTVPDIKVPEIELGLFVRDDGTVDWDGAIASGKEVAKFGQELWERINGQDPAKKEDGPNLFGGSQRKEPEPESMYELRELDCSLQKDLEMKKMQADECLRKLKLTSDPSVRKELQLDLRSKAARLANTAVQNQAVTVAGLQLRLHRLNMDMERIYSCIEQDIKDSLGTTQEMKLLVAEFGMLDLQLKNLQISLGDAGSTFESPDGVIIDEGELELAEREISDLKLRLGMNLQSMSNVLDAEKAIRYVKESVDKVKKGVDFYVTGTKLLSSDVQYATSLITKAAQGYTLKPREVRMLRRSGKDILTLIPTIIILILPLTPVGHVLVFSFIQRFFPDFFPSTFTDRRQNLLRMYEQLEKRVDTWDVQAESQEDDVLEALRRNFVSTLQNASSTVGGKQHSVDDSPSRDENSNDNKSPDGR